MGLVALALADAQLAAMDDPVYLSVRQEQTSTDGTPKVFETPCLIELADASGTVRMGWGYRLSTRGYQKDEMRMIFRATGDEDFKELGLATLAVDQVNEHLQQARSHLLAKLRVILKNSLE